MNKQEAASFLGCSVRQLERYTSENRIGVRYEKGRTRPTPIYDEAELSRFKEEQDRPVHRPVIESRQDLGSEVEGMATIATDEKTRALKTTSVGNAEDFALLLSQPLPLGQVLAALARAGALKTHDSTDAVSFNPAPVEQNKPAFDLGPKLLLTLPECQNLTGLSREVLRVAIDKEELKARRIGRAWRVKRADLEAYIASL